MEVTEKVMPKNAQLLSLGHKDTCRLLEVYVKRSISLNDGTCVGLRSPTKPQKWVTLSEKCTRVRRHSSDTLINLGPSTPDEGIASSTPPDEEVVIPNVSLVEIPGPADIPEIETSTELENKSKKGKKKSKQTSFWKGFLGFFSTKGSDKKDEQESGTEKDGQSQGTLQKKTSIRQRSSMRRLSLRKIKIDSHRGSVKRPLALDRAKTTDITGVECRFERTWHPNPLLSHTVLYVFLLLSFCSNRILWICNHFSLKLLRGVDIVTHTLNSNNAG